MNFRNICALSLATLISAGCAVPVKDHKHAVCHKGKTIYVDESAVDAHIRHGDYGRACYGEREQGKGHEKHDHDKKDHDKKDRDDRD